jgi:hypothetical protein
MLPALGWQTGRTNLFHDVTYLIILYAHQQGYVPAPQEPPGAGQARDTIPTRDQRMNNLVAVYIPNNCAN